MTAKMRHCFFCGGELGIIESKFYERTDHCGSRECQREAQDMYRAEREEAHEQLDRDMGWDRW